MLPLIWANVSTTISTCKRKRMKGLVHLIIDKRLQFHYLNNYSILKGAQTIVHAPLSIYPVNYYKRSNLKEARSSSVNAIGCSQAAK